MKKGFYEIGDILAQHELISRNILTNSMNGDFNSLQDSFAAHQLHIDMQDEVKRFLFPLIR